MQLRISLIRYDLISTRESDESAEEQETERIGQ
jgi:hypothetical protein